MYKVYRFLHKHLKTIYGLWASFSSATILGNMNNDWANIIKSVTDLNNGANIVFFCWSCLLLVLTLIYFILKKSVRNHNPNRQFLEIMNEKT
ncbi:MAG: hypothetical protein II868_02550, partial [Butyrivibrio sp.]|nr:hypothetical protein [Butyrivibrio sp.]